MPLPAKRRDMLAIQQDDASYPIQARRAEFAHLRGPAPAPGWTNAQRWAVIIGLCMIAVALLAVVVLAIIGVAGLKDVALALAQQPAAYAPPPVHHEPSILESLRNGLAWFGGIIIAGGLLSSALLFAR